MRMECPGLRHGLPGMGYGTEPRYRSNYYMIGASAGRPLSSQVKTPALEIVAVAQTPMIVQYYSLIQDISSVYHSRTDWTNLMMMQE
jgi:hypothetical protein